LSDFNKIDFSLKFWNNSYQVPNFMKIRPVGAGLFHADSWTDGQTDRHDENKVSYRNFAKQSKNLIGKPERHKIWETERFWKFVITIGRIGNELKYVHISD